MGDQLELMLQTPSQKIMIEEDSAEEAEETLVEAEEALEEASEEEEEEEVLEEMMELTGQPAKELLLNFKEWRKNSEHFSLFIFYILINQS